MAVGAVIVAAGQGKRMGGSKLLLPLGDRKIIERTIAPFLDARCDPIVVVIGSQDERMRSLLTGQPVLIAENPDPSSEMLDSVQIGCRQLQERDWAVFFVHPGDIPLVTSRTLLQLIDALSHDRGKRIAIPTFKGRTGHPVLFDQSLYEPVLGLRGGSGLRSLVHSRDDVLKVPCDDPGVVLDIDSWEDYRRAVHLWAVQNLLGRSER